MSRDISRGTVVVHVERCKGCELCVPACPPGVLSMSPSTNVKGFHFPVLETGCTGCSACHMVCPDYVFDVFKFDLPVQSGTESS